jgi:7-cyano-7-deazaguanine synthase in queuosine biosynthesis
MSNHRLVLCGGASPGAASSYANTLVLNLQGAHPNVFLKIHNFGEAMARNVPELLVDLIELAAYVFAAEQGTGRVGARDTGEPWRRRFRFHVPVRHPELWSSEAVSSALVDLLSFLSDDDYEFVFTRLERSPSVRVYFDSPVPDFRIEEVLLFSGGLDSLAGAIWEGIVDRRAVALISHRSLSRHNSQIDGLAASLAERARPKQIHHIPVWATKSENVNREYTHHTRSFLYAALAAMVAVMMGRDRIRCYQNGVTSINLPIAPQLRGGSMNRTGHPQATRGLARFLSALLDRPFTVESPFLWQTKTDVLLLIKDAGCGALAAQTMSCARTFQATRLHTHCGRCLQCIHRRFAALAAGLTDEEDPPEMYKFDFLTGEQAAGDRTIAEAYLRRASRLRSIDELDFFADYPEATRSIRHVGQSSREAARRIVDLHRRHGEDLFAALVEGHKRYARLFQGGMLPDSSLLVLAVPGQYRQTAESGSSVPTFRLEGDYWKVWFEEEQTTMKDGIGLRHIARLLASPGRQWHCAELLAQEAGHAGPVPSGSSGEASDRVSIKTYRVWLEAIQEAIAVAISEGDVHRQAELQEEAEQIAAHLKAVTGLGGAPRQDGGDDEKARQAVSAAIRRAMKVIEKKHLGLWRHLRKFLKTGTFCCYDPSSEVVWVTK